MSKKYKWKLVTGYSGKGYRLYHWEKLCSNLFFKDWAYANWFPSKEEAEEYIQRHKEVIYYE